MTEPTVHEFVPVVTPPRKRRFPTWARYVAVGVTGLVVGIAGSGGSPEAPAAAEPLPAVTVTAPPVETVVEKAVVPAECLTALTDAEALMGTAEDIVMMVADHMDDDAQLFNQFSEFNFTDLDWYMDAQTGFISQAEGLTDRVVGNTFSANAALCRAA